MNLKKKLKLKPIQKKKILRQLENDARVKKNNEKANFFFKVFSKSRNYGL